MRHGIHAKARDPELQPEMKDVLNFPPYLRVGNVEVGLMLIERVIKILAGNFIVFPVAILVVAKDNVFIRVGRFFIEPDIILPVF